MTIMDTVLCNDPEARRLALEALEECTDLQAFRRRCLQVLLNSFVLAKADEARGAPYGERSPERANSRNGYRKRGLLASAGDVRVRIPKPRTGTFFPEDLIERYCRADRALVAAVAEMYVMGISTRKVEAAAGAVQRRPIKTAPPIVARSSLDALETEPAPRWSKRLEPLHPSRAI